MLWTHEAQPSESATNFDHCDDAYRVEKTIYHFKSHSICFLPQYQRNEIFVLTIEHTDSDLKVHALHYANELLVRVRLFQKLLQTRLIFRNNSKKCLGKE